jgi:hypothetical protein
MLLLLLLLLLLTLIVMTMATSVGPKLWRRLPRLRTQ